MMPIKDPSVVKSRDKSSVFRKVNNWLHLWLGLISGIIVFIVCITGCIWVFNEEITALLEPEANIEYQNKPVLSPAQLSSIGTRLFPGQVASYAYYRQDRAIELTLQNPAERGRRAGGTLLKINPYTGEVISTTARKKGDVDFFRFIINGHRFLWLPYEAGRLIVNYGTLVFVVILITGLIWWYPKKWTKSTREKSFKIKWGASFKRLNLDLHNVLGFYSLLFLLAIALTGVVWGIEWFSKGLYWATSGGDKLAEFERFESDSLQANRHYTPTQAMDIAWKKVMTRHPGSTGFFYSFPDSSRKKASIDITVYPDKTQLYSRQGYSFDQHTLKEFNRKDVYSISYENASFGGKLRKMNYDIHVGSILGFPGKVLAFLASLIGASLPVTGFLVWYGRKFKKKAKRGERKKGTSVQKAQQALVINPS